MKKSRTTPREKLFLLQFETSFRLRQISRECSLSFDAIVYFPLRVNRATNRRPCNRISDRITSRSVHVAASTKIPRSLSDRSRPGTLSSLFFSNFDIFLHSRHRREYLPGNSYFVAGFSVSSREGPTIVARTRSHYRTLLSTLRLRILVFAIHRTIGYARSLLVVINFTL